VQKLRWASFIDGLEGAGVRLNKAEFRALMHTAAMTREGDGGWDYNQFCALVIEAGGTLEGCDPAEDANRGTDVRHERTDAERFAISREIAEAGMGMGGRGGLDAEYHRKHIFNARYRYPAQRLDDRRSQLSLAHSLNINPEPCTLRHTVQHPNS